MDAAVDVLKCALALSSEGSGRVKSSGEFELGAAYFLSGDLEAAAAHLRRAVGYSSDVGHARGELRARMALAEVLTKEGDPEAARAETVAALGLAEMLGQDDLVAKVKSQLR